MEIKFKVSLKTVKRAFAFLEMDFPSDEELENKLSNTTVDLSDAKDEDTKQAELGFALLAIGTAFTE